MCLYGAAGWSYGKFRGDYWKHKGEKPLLTINAGKLTPGPTWQRVE